MKVDIHVKISITPEEVLALKDKKEKVYVALEKVKAEVEKKQMLDEIVNRILSEAGIEVKEDKEEQEHCSNEDFKNYLKIRDEEPWKIFGITEEKYNAYKKMYGRLSNTETPKIGESAQWITAKTCSTLHEFIRAAEEFSFSFL